MSAIRPLYLPAPYQDSALEGRLILRDGSTATIRLSRTEDRAALLDFFARLSPESRRLRFFSETKPGLDYIESLCGENAPGKQMTFVVIRIADRVPRVVATGSYIAHSPDTAEFAVAVDDAFQGMGLGGLILERLSLLAVAHGFVHFMAVTDAGNRPMLDVFRSSGFAVREDYQDGYVEVDLAIAPQARSVAHSELRDRLFTKQSMRAVFSPRGIAVVTASTDPDSPGMRVLASLRAGRYEGDLYAVTPEHILVPGVQAAVSARELPRTIDLAILAVSPREALERIDDCAERGARAVVVLSGGFADAGPEGATLQQRLVEKVRGYGMRLVGPNSFGVINTDGDARMNACLVQEMPPRGPVAISSQSGAVGMALLDLARTRRLGVSMFISMGNKADVTGNDLLQTWEDDPDVGVVLLYLESFGNPRRFARIARRVSMAKPIVCVKSGRSQESWQRDAAPGTPSRDEPDAAVLSLLRSSDTAVQALFSQTGVIRAGTLEQMFDLAALFSKQPLPRGRRVTIVTNSHGAAVLCADAAREARLVVAETGAPARQALRGLSAAGASTSPFMDLTAAAEPEDYRLAIEQALADDAGDAVIVIHAPVTDGQATGYMQAIRHAVQKSRAKGQGKPVAAVLLAGQAEVTMSAHHDDPLPVYLFPENAARALGAAADYVEWRSRPSGHLVDFDDTHPADVRALCRNALAKRGAGWLEPDETAEVLRAFGIPTPGAASPMGAAVAEAMIGMAEDPSFGPMLAFGLSGIHGEVLKDVACRITPLTERDAEEMIRGIRAFPLLAGAAGGRPADLKALAEVLLRVSLLAEEVPEVRALVFNPVSVYAQGDGCGVAGARIRVAPADEFQSARSAIAAGKATG
jgi:acyl-CoA synthetase (NDP forming)/GNAT superfamily N-acetyltransferase